MTPERQPTWKAYSAAAQALTGLLLGLRLREARASEMPSVVFESESIASGSSPPAEARALVASAGVLGSARALHLMGTPVPDVCRVRAREQQSIYEAFASTATVDPFGDAWSLDLAALKVLSGADVRADWLQTAPETAVGMVRALDSVAVALEARGVLRGSEVVRLLLSSQQSLGWC